MLRLLRRPPPWLGALLLVVGVTGLLLPWLLAPVIGDERYHYVAAPTRMDNSLFNVVTWTIHDIRPRMSHGRIAPVAVFLQQVGYLLGMQLSFATGIPLTLVHGLVKVVLLLSAVGSFALLLRMTRRRDGEQLDRGVRAAALLVFSVLLVLGVTATSPVRNGWTAYIVLCIGGISVMFLTGAASLWTLRVWPRATTVGKLAAAAAVFGLGAVVMLSYELHWAAVPFAVVLLAFAGSAVWKHRLALILSLSAGWAIAFIGTRMLLSRHDQEAQYAGTLLDLGGPVIPTAWLQVANAIPGSGTGRVMDTVGEGLPEPQPFGGGGWLWALLTAVGFAVLFARAGARMPDQVGPDRRGLLILAGALVVSAGAVATITSVSAQSHEIIVSLGDTYRGTPWIWAALAAAATSLLMCLPRGSTRRRRAVVPLSVAVATALVGVLVWPTTVSAVQTIRAVDQYALWETAQAQLVSGSAEPLAETRRCQLAEQAAEWARGKGPYFGQFLPFYENAFARQWNRPWCATSGDTAAGTAR
ncbi:hypothetical protein [Intrasporangium sp. DVR]|uniref:hypothetical protein n=1 Tax=Intrasporangium sp. DVR TaxID=3127867 RepID=UPI00313A6EF4